MTEWTRIGWSVIDVAPDIFYVCVLWCAWSLTFSHSGMRKGIKEYADVV